MDGVAAPDVRVEDGGVLGRRPDPAAGHNLDFWVPTVTATTHERLRDFPEADKGKIPDPVVLEDAACSPAP